MKESDMGTREPEPEKEPHKPGGRKHQLIEKMSSEDLAAAYGDGVRLRSHGISPWTDETLGRWLRDARDELRKRGQLDLIKEWLPVYFDPSRTPAVFGPGAPMVSQAAIERAITPAPRALKPAG
jgi:hypothetical protein